ncbi:MAG TPA: ABC transporter permease [Methylomirabilota bacterium]|jgi:peptide/nickel transport system permease protein|nr:ABC transporter permease [Methylomirabilota bacterium]
MRVLAFVGRRLLLLAVVMAIVSILIFGIVQVLPGDVAVMILGTSATPADLTALRQKLGLDRPAPLRYLDWVGGAVRGEWGTSLLYQVPVRPLVLERLGKSAVLAVLALAVAVPLAIGLGVLGALRRNRFLDQAVGLVTLVAVSLPEFIMGTVLILVLAFRFAWLPPSSLIDPRASLWSVAPSLVLPTLTLVLALLAHMTRMTRASMIDVLEQPYIRAARLRGLRPRLVILRHALRNALLPTVGIVAINVGFLIGGIVVVESVFAYPGLGRLMVDAVNHRDVPVIQMAALVIAVTYALANLAADLIYASLDPRIRY